MMNLAPPEGRGVEMDPALSGELRRHSDMDVVMTKLPLHAFYKARSVCKNWNSMPWSNTPPLRCPNPILFSTVSEDATKRF